MWIRLAVRYYIMSEVVLVLKLLASHKSKFRHSWWATINSVTLGFGQIYVYFIFWSDVDLFQWLNKVVMFDFKAALAKCSQCSLSILKPKTSPTTDVSRHKVKSGQQKHNLKFFPSSARRCHLFSSSTSNYSFSSRCECAAEWQDCDGGGREALLVRCSIVL